MSIRDLANAALEEEKAALQAAREARAAENVRQSAAACRSWLTSLGLQPDSVTGDTTYPDVAAFVIEGMHGVWTARPHYFGRGTGESGPVARFHGWNHYPAYKTPWQYWTGETWSTLPALARAIAVVDDKIAKGNFHWEKGE